MIGQLAIGIDEGVERRDARERVDQRCAGVN